MNKKNLVISVIGNILEWYDFIIYAYLAPIISQLFFPSHNYSISLIKTFGVFAIGYLMRPIGGLVFAQFGDKIGRKKILRFSILFMGFPSILLGFLPSYAKIGMLAPVLLIILRLIQGFSAGGELVGSTTYVYEIASKGRKAFWCSFVTSSSMAGGLCGSIVTMLLHNLFSPTTIMLWAWRIPFWAGVILVIFGFWLRQNLDETEAFQDVLQNNKIIKFPVYVVIKKYFPQIIQIIGINIFVSTSIYVLFVWLPSYLQLFLSMPAKSILAINTIAMAILIILTPLAGWISDRIGIKKLALFSASSIGILSYPLFKLMEYRLIFIIFIIQVIFAICLSCIEGTLSVIMGKVFPTKLRLSGISMGYNISTSIFGGTAPMVCIYLIHITSLLSAPAIYLAFTSLVALPALLSI